MFQRWLVASAAILSFSVAHAADEPKWLTDAKAREGKLGAPKDVVSDDKWLKAKLPGKIKNKIEKAEGSYSIEVDIGTTTPVLCEIIPDGFDLANMLRATLERHLTNFEQAPQKIEMRQNERIDSGAYGRAPWLSARWLFLVNDGQQKNVGQYQHAVFSKDGHGGVCQHDDIGYVKTFETVVKALAETLEFPGGTAPSYYSEIATVSLGGSRVGVSSVTLRRDADGDTVSIVQSAMLLPTGPGQVSSQDTFHQEFQRPDGSLINAIMAVSGNGELGIDVALKTVEGAWTVSGTIQGKEITQKLAAGEEPSTSVQQARELRTILASDKAVGTTHETKMWVSADPTRLTKTTTKITSKIGPMYLASAQVGPMKVDLTLDSSGMVTAAKIPMGPQVVTIDRVYVNGSF
jgi:hypothetical protein